MILVTSVLILIILVLLLIVFKNRRYLNFPNTNTNSNNIKNYIKMSTLRFIENQNHRQKNNIFLAMRLSI